MTKKKITTVNDYTMALINLCYYISCFCIAYVLSQGGYKKNDILFTLADLVDKNEEVLLSSLLKQTELWDMLSKPGNYTLFGPTDDAFLSLPQETRDNLMNDNKKLTSLLQYHVINGTVDITKDLTNELLLKTLNGQDVRINVYQNRTVITMSGQKLRPINIAASNGAFNILEGVMFPPIGGLADTADQNPQLKTLTTLIMESGLYPTLSENGPFTLFAPTDVTFSKLPRGAIDDLLQNIPVLNDLLTFHVIPGTFYREGLHPGRFETLEGHVVNITEDLDGFKINGVGITSFDLSASNGVIHIIDSILTPPKFPWMRT